MPTRATTTSVHENDENAIGVSDETGAIEYY